MDEGGPERSLRGLLPASRRIFADLDLDVVLRRIVEAAAEIAEADYAALGVIGPEGRGLERFIHIGLDESTARAIGDLPEGKGLLGLLIEDPRPIRLRELREHPQAAGFPEHHPAMCAFLGVPIRARGEVYGNLYLTRREGREFTADDEEAVLALAASAGVAIENARLFDEARRRQDWLATSTEVTRRLLAQPGDDSLQVIAESVFDHAGADLVMVAQVTGEGSTITVRVAVGDASDALTGATYDLDNTVSELVLETGEGLRMADAGNPRSEGARRVFLADRATVGPVMVVPLLAAEGARGVLWVARAPHAHPFTASDQDMLTTFANQASIAWELADARRAEQQVELLEERARIARDLHDHVIQRLFATGLGLQALAGRADLAAVAGELDGVVDDIDDVITQIRSSIFQLRPIRGGLRSAILDVVGEVRSWLGFEPHVVFEGPIDNLATRGLANDVTAVLREALTNVAKHAGATSTYVRVVARAGELVLTIADNGRGVSEVTRTSGLANMRARAEAHSGTLVVGAHTSGSGTRVEWRVPL